MPAPLASTPASPRGGGSKCRGLVALLAALLIGPAFAAPPAQLAAYLGPGCNGRDRVAAFEQWLGRPLDRVVDFLAVVSWQGLEATAMWAGSCWSGHAGRLVVSIPMLPQDGQSNLAAGARGDYDAKIRTIATRLIERGHGSAVIRLGWEFNANWFPWSSLQDPAAYVAYWRRYVTVLRSVPGANFRFDWTPVLGLGVASPEPAYPGDEWVDIIGADVYNVNWLPANVTPQQRWQLLREAPFGLQWHARFAAAHGKPMSYPEWGTGTRPDGHGGGDDPVFMAGMTRWIAAHNVEYHGYWDFSAPDYNARLSDGSQPAAAAIYLNAYGGPR